MRISRRLALATTAAAAVVLLAGCANQQPGAAATFGDQAITEAQLADQVAQVQKAQNQPVDSANASLTTNVLHRMLLVDLVGVLAEQKGVKVTQGEIDSMMRSFLVQFETQQGVEENFLGNGIPPSEIENVARFNLQAQKLGLLLAPNGTADQQSQALFAAVSQLSDDLDTTMSPRYGTWDPASLGVGPAPEDLAVTPTS
jgi:PBP1b-binding outer membrane lipoprotein LpoB